MFVDSPGVPRYGLGMCMSPDELSNQQILDTIAAMRGWIESGRNGPHLERFYARRIELYEGLLKERAEAGTYANH